MHNSASPPTDDPAASAPEADSGLLCLATVMRVLGQPADPQQLAHRFGRPGGMLGPAEIVRAARQLGLIARAVESGWKNLEGTPLPALAGRRGGGFVVLAGVRREGEGQAETVLILDPREGRPTPLPRAEFEALWDGTLILLATRAGLAGALRRFDLTWFIPTVVKYRRHFGEAVLGSFVLQLLALASPILFQVVIDKVMVHRSLTTLDVLVVGLVGVTAFEALFGILRTYLFAHTTSRVDVELGARLFGHLMALPLAYFGARRVGDTVARVRELENVRSFLTGSAVTVAIDLVFAAVFIAVMLIYSGALTVVVLAAVPFYVGLAFGITPLLRRRLDEKFVRGAENQAYLVERVTGVETIKAMAVEPQMQRRWEELLAAYVKAAFRVVQLANVANQGAQLVNKLTMAVILWIGAKLVIDGSLTVGELVAFNMLAGRLSAPILRLAQLWQDFQQMRLSVERLGDILNTRTEPGSTAGRASLPPLKGAIRFDRVTFRYRPDEGEVLRQLSLDIQPGQVVGIVGPSGSGKSTLVKLVQRLYVPESGRVAIDGLDLALVDPMALRRQIGVVLQDNVLFTGTIRENIALADPGLDLPRVTAAAELAGAHEFILKLPQGYDTVVGERGSTLSGGQRQRIAIARALVGNPRILIFDEATSALDVESEAAIQRNMRRICAGRTVLIIAHRLSAVRHADRVVVVEEGRIVEDGPPDQLLRQSGRFATLHSQQAGGLHAV